MVEPAFVTRWLNTNADGSACVFCQANIPTSQVRNDLHSIRLTLAMFWGQPWGNCWVTEQSMQGPFQALWCHLDQELDTKNCHQATHISVNTVRVPGMELQQPVHVTSKWETQANESFSFLCQPIPISLHWETLNTYRQDVVELINSSHHSQQDYKIKADHHK